MRLSLAYLAGITATPPPSSGKIMDMKSVQKQSGVLLKGGSAVVPAPGEGFNRMKLGKRN